MRPEEVPAVELTREQTAAHLEALAEEVDSPGQEDDARLLRHAAALLAGEHGSIPAAVRRGPGVPARPDDTA